MIIIPIKLQELAPQLIYRSFKNLLSFGLGTKRLWRCFSIFLAYLAGAAATGGGTAGGGGCAGGAGGSRGESQEQHTRTQSRKASCS